MSIAKTRISRLFWVFFEKFGIVILSIVSFFIYALYLTPEQLGIGVLLLSIVEFCSMFLIAAVDSSMIRQKDISKEQDGTAFWFLLSLSVLLSIIVFTGYYYFVVDTTIIFIAAFIVVFLIPLQSMTRVQIVHIRRRKAFRKLASVMILSKIAGISIGIALALNGFGELVLVAQAVSMSLISLVIIFISEKRAFPLTCEVEWLKAQITVGTPSAIKAMSTNLYNKGLIVLIEITLGTAAVGFYNFANRLIELPRAAILSALMGYANPVFSQRNNSGKDIAAFFLQCTNIGITFVLPIFIGLSLVGTDLITVLFGNKWDKSIPLFVAIAMLAAVNIVFLFLPSVLVAHGKTAYGLKGQILGNIIALLVFYLLVDDYLLNAVIAALLVRVLIYFFVNLYACLKATRLKAATFFGVIYKPFIACILMWVITNVTASYLAIERLEMKIASEIAIGGFVYALVLVLLNPKIFAQVKEFISVK